MTAEALQAFEAEGLALEAVLDDLEEKDFARPTNCPPWTVKDLVVHIAQGLYLVGSMPPTSKPVEVTAADIYLRPERRTAEYHAQIADKAQAAAAELPDGPSAAVMLRDGWRAEVAACHGVDLGVGVESPYGVVRRADLLLTRVVAHAAHGLDLALSLDREPWTTPQALAVMRPVFVALLEDEPAGELGWTDLDFFAAATGRRALTASERQLLGAAAARFPLLS